MEATANRVNTVSLEEVTKNKPSGQTSDSDTWAEPTTLKRVGEGARENDADITDSSTRSSGSTQKQTTDELESEKLLENLSRLDSKSVGRKGIAEIRKEVEETKELTQEEKIWRLAATAGTTQHTEESDLD